MPAPALHATDDLLRKRLSNNEAHQRLVIRPELAIEGATKRRRLHLMTSDIIAQPEKIGVPRPIWFEIIELAVRRCAMALRSMMHAVSGEHFARYIDLVR